MHKDSIDRKRPQVFIFSADETIAELYCKYLTTGGSTMKIINTGRPVKANEFADYLRQKLNPLFKERRQKSIIFDIKNEGNIIEILQPEYYEGPLFTIETEGTLLRVSRSEHYVDDVNSLTLESILSDLFKDVAGKYGTDLIQEG